jgi:glycosyltransferase involved in cell wall biosynthesis
MRIVIDMQGAQTESRFRGIGRYTLSFAQAVVRNRGEHEVILAVSGLFPDTIEPIRVAFDGLLPQQNIRVWYALGPIKESEPGNEHRREVAELIREAFLVSLQPDVIHITSFFEGYEDDAVTSIGKFDQNSPVSVFVYDGLNDYSIKKSEKNELGYASFFQRKLDEMRNAAIRLNVDEVYWNESLKDDFYLESIDWDKEALDAIEIWLLTMSQIYAEKLIDLNTTKRHYKPRLAFVSPFPPEHSGIADYSAELLPLLMRFYEIDVVTDQENVDCEVIKKHSCILNTEDFAKSANNYDRIIYHFGNNPMHVKMFELLERFPGVVVLHDFFLSGVHWYREANGFIVNSLWNELYSSHGYKAVMERSLEDDKKVVFRYPCSLSVIQKALAVIVHSPNTSSLVKHWYGMEDGIKIIPLMRNQPELTGRDKARRELGFSDDDFLVCSFGFIGETKENHRLLNVWESSLALSEDKRCKLVFVGGVDESIYGKELIGRIGKYRNLGEVKVTGWTDSYTYRLYLAAADVAIQLRTLSRGETSAAVLDCLNHGIATVINSNGSMADIPNDFVRKIPDQFNDDELLTELEFLLAHPEKRSDLGNKAQKFIRTVHAPDRCAEEYIEHIERAYLKESLTLGGLISLLPKIITKENNDISIKDLAFILSLNHPSRQSLSTIFLDVSVIAQDDFKTGIQRVVRALTLALIDSPPGRFRIEPVFLKEDDGIWSYRYARDYTLSLINVPSGWIGNEKIEAQPGDVFLGLDLAGGYVIQADLQGVYRDLRNHGVQVSFVVYDLIPVMFENIYPRGFKEGHADWLKVVTNSDSAICISKSVASDLEYWISENLPERSGRLRIKWFHLGADINKSSSTKGFNNDAFAVIQKIKSSVSFLMVGTIEPRKGHEQTIKAFDLLWSLGLDINLIIVGKEGWMVNELASSLRQHPELGRRLHWLNGINDEYLLKVYESSACLLAASLGEGFGLPLIEAAHHKIPIVARDIPVFREVAGEHAFYFNGLEPTDLSLAIQTWLALYQQGQHPKSDHMPWLTWKESAQNLLTALGLANKNNDESFSD